MKSEDTPSEIDNAELLAANVDRHAALDRFLEVTPDDLLYGRKAPKNKIELLKEARARAARFLKGNPEAPNLPAPAVHFRHFAPGEPHVSRFEPTKPGEVRVRSFSPGPGTSNGIIKGR